MVFPMRCALFSALAALPELETLEIIDCDFVEKWDASEDIYQCLKTLRLQSAQFSEWEVDSETFPKLEELILEHCYERTEIPCAFGDIDTLKSIRVVQIDRELGGSAMEIKKDVEAFTGEDRFHVHVSSAYADLSEEEEEAAEETEGKDEEELNYGDSAIEIKEDVAAENAPTRKGRQYRRQGYCNVAFSLA